MSRDGVGIDQWGLVAIPNQRTVADLIAVEKLRMHATEMPHATAKIPNRGMQQQVVVVAHQAIGMKSLTKMGK